MSLIEHRLNKYLTDPTIDEANSLISIATSPARFDTQTELRNHLQEGSLLNIGLIGSKALSVPCGDYMVMATNAGHTMLVPIKATDKELFASMEDHYDILTPNLINNWNKVEKVLSEEEDPSRRIGGPVPNGIDMSTVDRTPLARAMEERGMTETELANICGVDVPAISRILRKPKDTAGDPGGRNPSMELASKICAALRLDPQAAFPDFFKVDGGHAARETPGNAGSGGGAKRFGASSNRAGGHKGATDSGASEGSW